MAHRVMRRFAATEATPVDRRKTLEALLPLLRTPAEAVTLLDLFGTEPAARVVYLFRAGGKVCYFLLFRQLQALDDPGLVRKYCFGSAYNRPCDCYSLLLTAGYIRRFLFG